ncbi:hypothetical protein FCV67_07905 [Vibrio sp. F13]|nr:hypothetical protein FCV67_07905 [Vibrio sp. F13]
MNRLPPIRKTININELISRLSHHTTNLPPELMCELLSQIELNEAEMLGFVGFDIDTYSRKSLYRDEYCDLVIIGWLNGQRSPIHDHLNSICGLKVLKGDAIQTDFKEVHNGLIYATGSTSLNEGVVHIDQCSEIHQLSNLELTGAPLITLHLYSPPLETFNIYKLSSSRNKRAINTNSW